MKNVTGGSFCRAESLVILTFPGVEARAGKLSAAEIRLSSQYKLLIWYNFKYFLNACNVFSNVVN
jgi:hypothetical protein